MRYSPILKTQLLVKYFKDNKYSGFHLTLKNAWIYVLGHYLFLKAHSFPRATFQENCSLIRAGL